MKSCPAELLSLGPGCASPGPHSELLSPTLNWEELPPLFLRGLTMEGGHPCVPPRPRLGPCVFTSSRFPPGRSEGEPAPREAQRCPFREACRTPASPPARPPPQAHLGQVPFEVQIPVLAVPVFGGEAGASSSQGDSSSMDIWVGDACRRAGKEAGTRPSSEVSPQTQRNMWREGSDSHALPLPSS